MQDGVAYVYNLKRILGQNNMPLPAGIVVTEEMFAQIEHAFKALVRYDTTQICFDGEAILMGIKIYREKK